MGLVAGSGIKCKLYQTILRQLHQNLAHGVVGNLHALTCQPLVDGRALEVALRLRSLLDPLRPLTDDGFDLPTQLPAHVFGHVSSSYPPYTLLEPRQCKLRKAPPGTTHGGGAKDWQE